VRRIQKIAAAAAATSCFQVVTIFKTTYDFIFDGDDRRVVDHVLHSEHLHEEQESAIPRSKLRKVGPHNLTADTLLF
jgi:hypothetical protein